MHERIMNDLYENFHSALGWLGDLEKLLCLSDSERNWLIWRDDQQFIVDHSLSLWTSEVARAGGWDDYVWQQERQELIDRLVPDRVMSYKSIENARRVPLWQVMGVKDKTFILCPVHKERSESFYVRT